MSYPVRVKDGDWDNEERRPKELSQQEALLPLILEAQNGDAEAMEELAWRVAPLVYRIAIKYGHGHDNSERYNEAQRREILQEAWVGFLDAVQRYDPNHASGLRFWTVASYRITIAIKHWQAENSGALPMTRTAWEQAHRIDKALEASEVTWETLSAEELREVTGVHSAGAILRARQTKQGHLEADELFTWGTTDHSTGSAEEEYLDEFEDDLGPALLEWLDCLVPGREWEEATYWELERLGLAGEVEVADLFKTFQDILEADDETGD